MEEQNEKTKRNQNGRSVEKRKPARIHNSIPRYINSEGKDLDSK